MMTIDSAEAAGSAGTQRPNCVGSFDLVNHAGDGNASNCFRSTQWSPDGTSIITNSNDNILRTFILPNNLLDEPSVYNLQPDVEFDIGDPIYATAISPWYNRYDPNTARLLYSPRDLPIRIANPIVGQEVVASYPLIHSTTEKYITPHSLAFCTQRNSFVAGSDSLISTFDLEQSHQGPSERAATIPSKRKKQKGGGVGMKGIVSAVSISCNQILAAGTFTRNIGLYAMEGIGEAIATFSIASDDEELTGRGVTQVLWSPCGQYLYIAERMSDIVQIYDVRMFRRLGYLKGRQAMTNQRMCIDLRYTSLANGYEIWAGGKDGVVRAWLKSEQAADGQGPSFEWPAHIDTVSSAVFNPWGTIMATSSGQYHNEVYSNMLLSHRDTDVEESDSASSSTSSPSAPFSPGSPPAWDHTLRVWSFM